MNYFLNISVVSVVDGFVIFVCLMLEYENGLEALCEPNAQICPLFSIYASFIHSELSRYQLAISVH